MRKEGYYWIRMSLLHYWEVARWDGMFWRLVSNMSIWHDDSFIEIDERQIIMEEKE